MSSVVISGDTSGAITVAAPAVAGSNTMTLPAATDTFAVQSQAVRQVVSTVTGAVATGTTTIPLDDTIPQNTEGDQYMTLSITPKSATSTLNISVNWFGASSQASPATMIAALFQDSTANALAVGWCLSGGAGYPISICFNFTMTSGTTSATTFKVRAGCNTAGTTTFNGIAGGRDFGGKLASSIVITEIGG